MWVWLALCVCACVFPWGRLCQCSSTSWLCWKSPLLMHTHTHTHSSTHLDTHTLVSLQSRCSTPPSLSFWTHPSPSSTQTGPSVCSRKIASALRCSHQSITANTSSFLLPKYFHASVIKFAEWSNRYLPVVLTLFILFFKSKNKWITVFNSVYSGTNVCFNFCLLSDLCAWLTLGASLWAETLIRHQRKQETASSLRSRLSSELWVL